MPGADRAVVDVTYEHSSNLPLLLDRLNLSVLLTTYQAGRVVSLGSHRGELQVGFSHFDRPMGLCRTPTGLAVGCREAIWNLPASAAIAPSIPPRHRHDIAFLARSCHHSGPLMGHDLAWGEDRIWLVNTLFSCLATLEEPWSFVPRWKPPFITELAAGDRCHLNGLAMAEDGSGPAYVSALGETDTVNGWRERRHDGGCLIAVASGDVLLRGLAMPHSPRLHQGQLLLLDSGRGALLQVDPIRTEAHTVVCLPGFARGMDCHAGHAFIGLSRLRDSTVFSGLPLAESGEELRCGLAVVDLSRAAVVAMLWFHAGVEEVFAVSVLPGWRNPVVIGPHSRTDNHGMVWMVPPGPGWGS